MKRKRSYTVAEQKLGGLVPRKKSTSLPSQKSPELQPSDMTLIEQEGETVLEFSLQDTYFENIRCLLQPTKKGLVATFIVEDVNTRRLFEAQLPLLCQTLEQRGMRVQTVKVLSTQEKKRFK